VLGIEVASFLKRYSGKPDPIGEHPKRLKREVIKQKSPTYTSWAFLII